MLVQSVSDRIVWFHRVVARQEDPDRWSTELTVAVSGPDCRTQQAHKPSLRYSVLSGIGTGANGWLRKLMAAKHLAGCKAHGANGWLRKLSRVTRD